MIQFSSVLGAVYTFSAGYADGSGTLVGWPLFTLSVGAVLALIALVLFLTVEKVHWSSGEDISDEKRHSRRLLDVRNKRTIRYRIGWQFSIVSTGWLVAALLLIFRGT